MRPRCEPPAENAVTRARVARVGQYSIPQALAQRYAAKHIRFSLYVCATECPNFSKAEEQFSSGVGGAVVVVHFQDVRVPARKHDATQQLVW